MIFTKVWHADEFAIRDFRILLDGTAGVSKK